MTIHDLLQSSSEITLRKGEKFLKDRALQNLRRQNDMVTSIVKDGETYGQKLLLDGENIVSYDCSCQEHPVICSHLAALLLKLERKTLTPFTAMKKPKAYLSQEKGDLRDMLEKASKEELISFILSLRSSYRDMPVLIRKNFIGLSHMDALKTSQERLDDSYENLRRATVKDFTSHSALLLEIHENARKESKERNYLGATLLYLLLIEASSRETFTMEGYLFYNHHMRIYEEALLVLSEKKYTGAETFMIFQFLGEIADKLVNLDECSTLMTIMKNYLTTEKDFDLFYDILVKLMQREDLSPMEKNNLLFIEYELLMMVDKESEAHALRQENPGVFEFLFMDAKLHMKNGEFTEALTLIDTAIIASERNWDHKIQWLYLKARLLKKLHNHDALLQVTLELIALGEYKAYTSLKKTVGDTDFKTMYEILIEDLRVQENIKGVYLRILLEEEDKVRLLDYVRHHEKTIWEHFEILHPEYAKEAAELLAKSIMNEAKSLKDEDDFSFLLSLMEKLYIYGHEKVASETIMSLVMTYKYKTALHGALFTLKDAYAKDTSYEDEMF